MYSTRIFIAFLVGATILCAAACNSAGEFYVDTLEVQRPSWDSLYASATFGSRTGLRGGANIFPDVVTYIVYDAKYDTLASGSSGRFLINDVDLQDRERLLVEVCGYFDDRKACDQQTLAASPKRIQATYEVEFPTDSIATDRGRIHAQIEIERWRFESEVWELIHPSSRMELYALAYAETDRSATVKIPISRSSSRFILSRYSGARDLRYAIQSSIMDSDSVVVRFDLYGRLSSEPVLVATQRVLVRQKTQSERMSEIGLLAERTGAQILEHIAGFFGVRRAYVFINDWSFKSIDKAYQAEFELHWQESFRGEWSDLTAELNVGTGGTMGTVVLKQASERAQRRWFSKFGGRMLELDPLLPENLADPSSGEDAEMKSENKRGRR